MSYRAPWQNYHPRSNFDRNSGSSYMGRDVRYQQKLRPDSRISGPPRQRTHNHPPTDPLTSGDPNKSWSAGREHWSIGRGRFLLGVNSTPLSPGTIHFIQSDEVCLNNFCYFNSLFLS